MRDEDLKNLPQSIEAWRVMEMLRQLGVQDVSNVPRMVVLPRSVQVDVFATDSDGKKMLHTAEDGAREVSVHRITLPIVGPWEKPDEAPRPCGAVCLEGAEICELPEAHYFHRAGHVSWP